jgi:hypothetical protein
LRENKTNESAFKESDVSEEKSDYQMLCSSGMMRTNIIVMTVIWSFSSFAFFLVPFYLNQMEADIYYLSLATETAEFIASVACLYITQMPLKRALFFCLILVSCGSLGISIIGENKGEMKDNMMSAGLILITNMGVVAAFDIAYLINAKLFPTTVLATAFGVCNIFGRAVSIGSPLMARIPAPWPMVVVFGFAITCSLLTGLLK